MQRRWEKIKLFSRKKILFPNRRTVQCLFPVYLKSHLNTDGYLVSLKYFLLHFEHFWWMIVEPCWMATKLISGLTLAICPMVETGPTRTQHCSAALQTEIQHLWLSCIFIKRVKQRPRCCQCPQAMANTFQAEKKNHLTLCTAPRITQSQPKQVGLINGNRQLETQVKDRRCPCLSSFPFAYDAKWPPDCSPGFL